MLENRFQVLDGVFIVGNLKFMGVERFFLKLFLGVVEEVQQVVKIFGVKFCKEENIIKEVVVKVFVMNSVQVVLFVIYGFIEKDNYFFGVVVF